MNIDISKIEKTIGKLKHKDSILFKAVQKKITQIAASDNNGIEHFKNLRHDLSNLKRVRIRSFVLVFRVKGETIIFEDFDHHDKIYNK